MKFLLVCIVALSAVLLFVLGVILLLKLIRWMWKASA